MNKYNNRLIISKKELDNIKKSDEVDIDGTLLKINFLKKIIKDNRYFSYVEKFFKGEINSFSVCAIYNDDFIGNISYSKPQIIKGIDFLIKNRLIRLNLFQKERLKTLKKLISFDKFLNDMKDEKYKIKVDNNEYLISVEDIIKFLLTSEDEFNKICVNDDIKSINGIKKEHFIYASCCILRKIGIFDNYLVPKKIIKRYDKLKESKIVDIQSVNKYLYVDDVFYRKIKINEQLEKEILNSIPDDFSNLEKAIYIYIKMCKLLTYDDEYFVVNQRGIATYKHKDINYINDITLTNNKIVCFEFVAIYSKLLSNLKINFMTDYGGILRDEYGENHAKLSFRSDKFIVSADSVTSILLGDIMQAKLNQPLRGLICINKNDKTQQEFLVKLKKVYEFIAKEDNKSINKDIQKVQSFEEIVNEYVKNTKNIKNISIDEKLSILIKKLKSSNLVGIDFYSYLIQLKKILFTEQEKSNNIFVSIIKNNKPNDSNLVAEPCVIIALNKDGFKENQDNIYYYLDKEGLFIKVNGEEIQSKFNDKSFEYITDNTFEIPGIIENKGASK